MDESYKFGRCMCCLIWADIIIVNDVKLDFEVDKLTVDVMMP